MKETLFSLRSTIALREWPDQNILTGKTLMSDLVVDALASRAREISSLEAVSKVVRWVWAPKFGQEVVDTIQSRLLEFPDLEQLAREERAREQAFAALEALAQKDLQKKLRLIFDGCYDAILAETVVRKSKSVKRCQVFLSLLKRNVHIFFASPVHLYATYLHPSSSTPTTIYLFRIQYPCQNFGDSRATQN